MVKKKLSKIKIHEKRFLYFDISKVSLIELGELHEGGFGCDGFVADGKYENLLFIEDENKKSIMELFIKNGLLDKSMLEKIKK